MSEQTATPARIEMEGPDGLSLKQLIPNDAQPYFDLVEYDRPHLSQHGDETADKYKSVDDVLESIIHPKNPDKLRFGIWVYVVMVGSNNLTPLGDGIVESGSWIGKEHLGHHYAAKARELLIDLAFNQLGFSEVHSEITVGNEASRKSVEKSGFILEGEHDGKWLYILRKGVDYGR